MAAPTKPCVRKWLSDQFGDDESVIAEIYGEYIATTGENIAKAETALAAKDFTALDRVAHTLKGNGLMVGDQEAADAAIALRHAAQAADADGCAACLGEVRRLYAEVCG